MRIVTALAVVVAGVGLGWSAGATPALADGDPPPKYCVQVSVFPPPPAEIKPTILICQP